MTKYKKGLYLSLANLGVLKGEPVTKEAYEQYEDNDEYIILRTGLEPNLTYMKYKVSDFDPQSFDLFLKIKNYENIKHMERYFRFFYILAIMGIILNIIFIIYFIALSSTI